MTLLQHKAFNSTQLTKILEGILKAPIPADIIVCDIQTDTRTLTTGQTFAAISGERFDGHQFIDTAIANGANAVIVEQPQKNCSVAQIVVTDTFLALARIATAIRNEFVTNGGKIVGITGSAGKTTNKQMLASICSQVGKTHYTQGNFNNHLGVPLTWFSLPHDAQFAVIEMGANHKKEIDYLTSITKPHIAMITNAGEAHLEGFGGIDGVAEAKGEIFNYLQAGNTAVINADDKYADYWIDTIRKSNILASIKTFSLNSTVADVYASDIAKNGSEFTLHAQDTTTPIHLPTVGVHNVRNALGCAACAIALGIDLDDISKGLTQFSNAAGRLQITQLNVQQSCITLIDDTYNANPVSMRASADIVSASDDYRILILGDMGELGSNSEALHTQLGIDLIGKADSIFCVGEKMQALAESNSVAKHFSNKELLTNALFSSLQALLEEKKNITILVKGSRSMQMEQVVQQIQELQHKKIN